MTDTATNIKLGDRYRDTDTGFEGIANAVTIYEFRCPRVQLTALVDHKPAEHWFDEPKLEHVNGSKRLGFG